MKDVCEEIEYQKHRTHAQAAKEAWSGPTGDWLELCSVADDYEKKDFEDMCQYLDMEAAPSQSTGRKLAMSSNSPVGVVVAGKKGFALPSQGMQAVIRNSGALSQHDRRCGTCKDRMNGGTVNLCMTKVPSSGPIHMGRPAGIDLSRLQADAFLAKPMFWRNNAAPKVSAPASTAASNEPQQVHSDWNGPMGDWADLCVAIDDQGDMKDVCEEIEYQKHRTHAQAAKEAWSGPTGDWLELCSVADDYEKKDFEDMCQYLDMEADPSQSTGRKLAMSSDSQVGVVVAGKKGFALPSQGMQAVIRNSGALSQHDRRCGTCKDRMNGG